MSTKTFKVGEYGHCPKYKLTTKVGWVQVQEIGWDGKVAGVREFRLDTLQSFELYMWDETSSFHCDKMIEWIKSREEYVPTKRDPFTSYTFN